MRSVEKKTTIQCFRYKTFINWLPLVTKNSGRCENTQKIHKFLATFYFRQRWTYRCFHFTIDTVNTLSHLTCIRKTWNFNLVAILQREFHHAIGMYKSFYSLSCRISFLAKKHTHCKTLTEPFLASTWQIDIINFYIISMVKYTEFCINESNKTFSQIVHWF